MDREETAFIVLYSSL